MAQLLSVPRKTPAPARVDRKAAFVIRVLMSKRGLSAEGMAFQMLLAGIENAPSRSTIDRIVSEAGVPQKRHQRAIAEFFYGEGADPTRIWKVRS